MSAFFRHIAAVLLLLVGAGGAIAEPRIALIIGNGSYSDVTALDNPVSDAELMASTLRDKGFVVTVITDADQVALNRGIAQFGRDLRDAGEDATGLFYYAGHAVQSFGENYLLPVDTYLSDAADLPLVAVDAQAVLRQMRSARNRTNIVILDACRNNPFEQIADLGDNGLAEMKAPTGTFLSYSTAPGSVALDGLDGNSPFTKALAREMRVPGLPIEQTFKRVRVAVLEETAGAQTPWDTSSLTRDFYFLEEEPLSAEELQEQQLWESVSASDDPVQIMLFLRSYPEGRFEQEARALLGALMQEVLAPDASTTTPTLQPEAETPQAEPEAPEVAAVVPQAPAAQPSAPKVPQDGEVEMIAAAQESGEAADYEAYLAAYPDGLYAELAEFELQVLQDMAALTAAPAEETREEIEVAAAPSALPDYSGLTFTTPLPGGPAPLRGLSIEQVVDLAPNFPPIEGLPDELWKDQSCSTCHEWTQEALCTQGNTYAAASSERALTKEHPFGGAFKQALRIWATEGCQ
ncbi:MAG: caspase family protein [Pseudomonadota bacterium]